MSRLSEQIASAVAEAALDDAMALGWKPVSPGVFEKGGKRLHRRGPQWYVDDMKLGRMSDRALVDALRKLG